MLIVPRYFRVPGSKPELANPPKDVELNSTMIWLRPNAMGWFLLALFAGSQLLTLHPDLSIGFSLPSELDMVGIPAVAVYGAYSTAGPSTRLHTIHWLTILAVASIAYLLFMPVGRLATGGWNRSALPRKRRWWKQPVCTLVGVMLLTIVPASTGVVLFHELYWGYLFAPPTIDSRIEQASSVQTLTERARGSADTDSGDTVETEYRHVAVITSLGGDIPNAFSKHNLLKTTPATMPVEQFQYIRDEIVRSRAMDPGLIDKADITLAEFTDKANNHFLAVQADRIYLSNDHYAQYNLLFDNRDPKSPVLLSSSHFNYDIAGLEDIQWWQLGLFLLIASNVVAIPVTLIVMFVRRLRERTRDIRGFPVVSQL